MAWVRVVRAFRMPITAIFIALALSGCMRTAGPVAVAPQGDLDSMAYGQPNSPPPGGRGRFRRRRPGALRAAFAAAPRAKSTPVVVAAPVAYAEPAPVIRGCLSSRCRGQAARRCLWPGRPHQHLCGDAGGSITMPLIGLVRARGRATAGLRRRSRQNCVPGSFGSRRSR